LPNSNFNLRRNQLIEMAYKKLGVLQQSRHGMNAAQLDAGIKAINLIIREEDARGTKESKNLWALMERSLFIKANGFVYDVTDDFLASDILDLQTVMYRDSSGDEYPIELVTANGYEAITDKNEPGDPEKAYLKTDKDLSCQLLFIWPAPTSIATASEVTGTDGLNYKCTTSHTGAAESRPITGQSYRVYWDQQGSSGTTWVTGTSYTGGENIRYLYKRPLYDFDNALDNPDMPAQWTRYLMWRLAFDLSPEYSLTMEDRKFFKDEYMQARGEIFPSTQPAENSHYNRHLYY
jgi:hypothetical protein